MRERNRGGERGSNNDIQGEGERKKSGRETRVLLY